MLVPQSKHVNIDQTTLSLIRIEIQEISKVIQLAQKRKCSIDNGIRGIINKLKELRAGDEIFIKCKNKKHVFNHNYYTQCLNSNVTCIFSVQASQLSKICYGHALQTETMIGKTCNQL